jgi:pyruvate/2-oxoglutarate dehydrogenase complex dihydrolipoamide dehydrogenase (E3) component
LKSARNRVGRTHFVDAHTVATPDGERLRGERIILCTGGVSRRLDTPGAELTATHSDAWSLQRAPASVLVIGAGATGAQLASVLNAFGARVQLFQAADRIVPTEEPEVSAAVASAFRAAGIEVNESFGAIEALEKTPVHSRAASVLGALQLYALPADLAHGPKVL